MKIGIIGNGFVGNALYENFKEHYECLVNDKEKEKCLNTLEEIYSCELIFVCLPTPMIDEAGGKCNTSIIDSFFKNIPAGINSVFAIKSTVPIGTTERLSLERKDLRIIHNPEFLTASNAKEDFKNSERNIFGGERQDCEVAQRVTQKVLPKARSFIMSSRESESVKYFANVFLTLKISYFNILYDFCEKEKINYKNIVDGVTSDSRIGRSHTNVPGPDGQRGFGGTCFPKDLNSLIDTFDKSGINNDMLKVMWEYNKEIRQFWDWAENKSAVLKGE